MPIPEFNKITQISANPSKKIVSIDAGFTTVIPAAGNASIYVLAPAGYICTVKQYALRYKAMAGAASGTMQIAVESAGGAAGIIRADGAYNLDLFYRYGTWLNPVTNAFPSDLTAQQLIQDSSMFDEVNGIKITFINNTPVSDAGVRKDVVLWVVQEKIS